MRYFSGNSFIQSFLECNINFLGPFQIFVLEALKNLIIIDVHLWLAISSWNLYIRDIKTFTHKVRNYNDIKIVKHRDFSGGPELWLHASTSGDKGSIPGWGTKISHAMWLSQNNNNKYKQSVMGWNYSPSFVKKSSILNLSYMH